jgi:hypothetical protein
MESERLKGAVSMDARKAGGPEAFSKDGIARACLAFMRFLTLLHNSQIHSESLGILGQSSFTDTSRRGRYLPESFLYHTPEVRRDRAQP